MSVQKVNHNVLKPWVAQSIAAASGSHTTEWLDVNGWTDKVFSYDVNSSGSIALTVTADISSQHYYELNNKTVTTNDYETVTLVAAGTGAIYDRVDAEDLDDMQRPWRSVRFKGVNADASDASVVTAQIEGWS